jgi:hypothetical protein
MAILSHKIPVAYLKRFATEPKKGKRLYVYEKGKPPRIGAPKSEAAERGFFAAKLPDGSIDDSAAEAWAQKIEDDALDVLIHAPNSCFIWTLTNRKRMAEYWALFFQRTTTFFDFHKNTSQSTFGRQLARFEADPEFRTKVVQHYSRLAGKPLSDEVVSSAIGKSISSLMEDSEVRHQFVTRLQHRVDLFSGILLNKPWQLWRVPAGRQFATSDNPVMTFLTDSWGRYSVGHGLGKEGVIVLLPISPTACIAAGISGYADRMIAEADVLEVNQDDHLRSKSVCLLERQRS